MAALVGTYRVSLLFLCEDEGQFGPLLPGWQILTAEEKRICSVGFTVSPGPVVLGKRAR